MCFLRECSAKYLLFVDISKFLIDVFDFAWVFVSTFLQHMWERRALVDIAHRLHEPLERMRRRNRVRDEATDVSTHVQYEAWLKHRANVRAPGERLVVDESVTVRDGRTAADDADAESALARHGSRLGRALIGKQKHSAGASAGQTQPSQAMYLYRLFADSDIAETAGGQWYAKLDCELSDVNNRPLFVGIDDDLKAASAGDMTRHRRRFEWLMARHWPQPAPWERPSAGEATVGIDAIEAARLQCARRE
jgi:hypothetical protein